MAQETLSDLLLDEVKDIYDAEMQLTEALPKMMEAASSKKLKSAFKKHLDQTEQQIKRLEDVFEIMGEEPKRKTCKAMKGLIAEGQDIIKEHDTSPLLDAALIGSAQRVEHYEIAAYGTSRAFAEALGQDQIAEMLQKTLDEERETDELLTEMGVQINEQCAKEDENSKPAKVKK